MASPTWWTWVWVNSGSWWWTGRPGVLRFMGSQRVGQDWVAELNWEFAQVLVCELVIPSNILSSFIPFSGLNNDKLIIASLNWRRFPLPVPWHWVGSSGKTKTKQNKTETYMLFISPPTSFHSLSLFFFFFFLRLMYTLKMQAHYVRVSFIDGVWSLMLKYFPQS